MRTILAIIALTIFAAFADTKPAAPTSPKEQPKKAESAQLPVLPRYTNWGEVTQDRREFRITGHPSWEAVGHIREDGRVFVLWTLLSTQGPCPGVYDFVDGELRGLWGPAADVQLNGDGTIEGNVRSDRTYAVPQPKEDAAPGF